MLAPERMCQGKFEYKRFINGSARSAADGVRVLCAERYLLSNVFVYILCGY